MDCMGCMGCMGSWPGVIENAPLCSDREGAPQEWPVTPLAWVLSTQQRGLQGGQGRSELRQLRGRVPALTAGIV